MKKEKDENGLIHLRKTDKYLYIYIYAVDGIAVRYEELPVIVLDASISDEELGREIMTALKVSCAIEIEGDIFDYIENVTPEIIEKRTKEFNMVLEQNGFKKISELHKTTLLVSCYLSKKDNILEYYPNYTKRGDYAAFQKDDGVENVIIPIDSDDEAVGQAAREAFARCKSIYKK